MAAMKRVRLVARCVVAFGALALSSVASAAPFVLGDVFASVGSGQVRVFDAAGNLKQTLNTGLGEAFTTGGMFDGLGNFYVTTFAGNHIAKWDSNGNLLDNTFMEGCNANCESMTRDQSGNVYVGQADGSRDVYKYDLTTGNFIQGYDVATSSVGPRGSDWVDLAADQKTLFYTAEGGFIGRYDVSTSTQLPNFNTVSGGSNFFALRILADGGLLVANTSNVLRYNSAGTLIQTYNLGAVDTLFALNLDPDGTTFWTGELGGQNRIFRVNVATGALVGTPFSAGSGTLAGLAIFGEQTQGCEPNCTGTTTGGTGTVPEPTALTMLGVALCVGAFARRRLSA